MKSYSRVSYQDRCHINALFKRNFSITEIATELGFHKSTISRELKRNQGNDPRSFYKGYFPQVAEKLAKERAIKRRKKKIIIGALKGLIIEKLHLGWSPEQISGRLKKEKKRSVSPVTIYRFLNDNPEYKRFLRFGTKRGIGRYKQRRLHKKKFLNIKDRPNGAENRSRYGHWERDGMYGADGKQLLVCIDRKSRYTKIGLMKNLDSKTVNKLTEKILKDEKVLTMTNDNGSSFRKPMDWDVPVYFCDPMKPQQRGSVENTIGVLRRFIKRNTNLEALGEKGIREIENLINNIPRKMFDYKTAFEVHNNKKVALVL